MLLFDNQAFLFLEGGDSDKEFEEASPCRNGWRNVRVLWGAKLTRPRPHPIEVIMGS